MSAHLDLLMFAAACLVLLMGFPVAFTLAGVALAFGLIGQSLDIFDMGFFYALPQRIFGTMTNEVLIAVPLFVFMGTMLERARVAEDLAGKHVAPVCRCARWSGHFGVDCRRFTGRLHRHCRGHGCNHEPFVIADHAAARLCARHWPPGPSRLPVRSGKLFHPPSCWFCSAMLSPMPIKRLNWNRVFLHPKRFPSASCFPAHSFPVWCWWVCILSIKSALRFLSPPWLRLRNMMMISCCLTCWARCLLPSFS